MASLSYDLTLAGLSVGSAAALTGIGLIVTHRATGVLNFAHGAIAMVCAYLLRHFTVEWDWPLWFAAAVTLLVVAPAIGLVLERVVFRPLAVLGGDPAQTLVASIGVFVLLVGGAALIWGQGARADVPTLVSADPWGQLAAAVVLALAVWAVTRFTRFGEELRAVVDDRRLAVLAGIDADRVAAAGWAFGSFTAGLTGVLLAPYVRLDPYGMPLLVMEVVAVAVAARMRNLPVAVVVALGIGVAQSQLTRLHPSGWGEPLLQAVGANLFVVALLIAALVLPGIGTGDALPRTATARVPTPPGAWIVAVVLFLIPLGFAGPDLTTSVQVPALGVILLSLVVVTGRGGQISLGQAAYAGLGALFTALLAAGRFPGLPELPTLAALAVAVLLVAPLGLLTGWPAISRHGLALALATFAVGVGVSRFVFAQPYATSGLALGRPAGFDGDRAYYLLELALLGGALLLVAALRRGRTGRALAAMRDHEAGAAAAGVPVRTLKLTAFVTGAALAALGGGMLGMGFRAFDPAAYDPVRGLLWFAAVVVLGADSLLGSLLAAALLVGLDAGTRGGVAAAVIGVLAILIGRFPGGPYEALRAATHRLRRRPHLTPLGDHVRLALATPAPQDPPHHTPHAQTTPPKPPRPAPHPPAPPTPATTHTSAADFPEPVATTDDNSRTPTHTDGTDSPATAHHPDTTPPADSPTNSPPPDSSPENSPPPAHSDHTRRTAHGTPPPPETGTPSPSAPGSRGDTPHPPHGPATAPPRPAPAAPPARPEPATPAVDDGDSRPAARATNASPPDPSPTNSPTPAGRDTTRHAQGFPLPKGTGESRQAPDTGTPGSPAGPQRQPGPAERPEPPGLPGPPRPPGPPPPAELKAHGLYLSYDGFTALHDVSLSVPPARVTALVGPNGAGKSSLFHCLAGALRPDRGRVTFGGRDITRLPAHARTRIGVARTFQQLAVFPTLTVAENVRVGAEQGRVRDPGAAERALRLFELDSVRDRPAEGLPTGTLRRVELARALAGDPHVLLLDEPAAGLDTAEVAALARILRALAADGTALLVVEHDLDLVAGLADRVYVLAAGHVVASGPADRVLDRDRRSGLAEGGAR
ncbi:ABC transporter permease subunit [Streptomyces flavofungini]|uniref:ATP-binding cassette domain-containing protein n=1 Tax=Streptomyces flavofungini TaxID=68200 RepID=A0ABS0XHX8_9ACTN|nr:ATP-binding cassette domain-containing protein [Streptomyces flavofungini]MBJ3812833.1 ATP-binding cassette domain-containing protein [Streptomyces flavofungini]GHC79590.1 hypothetical protein GCM10010349_61690 [Streptomyces flavofungini]